MNFTDGLNTVCEENGFGKSTLAVFLRVMLYGFDREHVRNEIENERKHYLPWDEKSFGGELVFEEHGKRYRISRIFRKTPKDDVVTILDLSTGLPTKEFQDNPGPALFGVNAESFERTAYVAQGDLESGNVPATAEIHAKIGHVSDDDADMRGYTRAAFELKNELNRLSPTRKTGLISREKDTIAALEAALRRKPALEREYEQTSGGAHLLKEKLSREESALEALRKRESALSAYNAGRAEAEKFAELKRQAASDEARRAQLAEIFSEKRPDSAELSDALLKAGKLQGLREKAESLKISPEEKADTDALCNLFKNGVPDEASFRKMEDTLLVLKELRREQAKQRLSDAEEEERKKSGELFRDGKPSVSDLSELADAWQARTRRKATLDERRLRAESLYSEIERMRDEERHRRKQKIRIRRLPLYLAAVLLILAAAVLLFRFMPAAGIGAAICSIVLIFLAGRVGKNMGTSDSREVASRLFGLNELQKNIHSDESMVNSVERSVQTMFRRLDLPYQEERTDAELSDLLNRRKRLDELQERYRRFQASSSAARADAVSSEIDGFLWQYGIRAGEDQYEVRLRELRQNVLDYYDGIAKESRSSEAEKQYREALKETEDYISFYKMNHLEDPAENLTWYRDRLLELENAEAAAVVSKKRLEDFAGSYDPAKAAPDPGESLAPMALSDAARKKEQEVSSIREDLKTQEEKLSALSLENEDLSDQEDQLKEHKKIVQALEKRYQLFSRTAEDLLEAKNRFTTRFVAPVQNRFNEYYRVLSAGDSRIYELDANLGIQIRSSSGQQYDTGYLSEGYRNLVALCRRMAMIDVMYQEDLPFLILDDPFVSLDEKRMAGAAEFLDHISKRFQIVYLVCNRSRVPE